MERGLGNEATVTGKIGPVRRLYNWVLSWAESRHGPAALGALSLAKSSFFPIPPDPLLIALSLGKPRKAFWFATICSVASVMGGVLAYLIGWGIWSVVSGFFYKYVPGVTPEAFEAVGNLYNRWDFWAIFAGGFSPLPYKVFTLAAGVFKISLPVFILASVISRSARFFMLASLIFFFGPGIKGFIDQHFNKLVWLFFFLLIGGFLLVSLVL